MTTRKAMWAGMDKLEGKEVGSSYKALQKERSRQGYKTHVKGHKRESFTCTRCNGKLDYDGIFYTCRNCGKNYTAD